MNPPPLRLLLAPVRGVTDAVYRGAFARCFGGFVAAVAPFAQLRQGQALRPADRRQLAPENNRDLATIPQLLTHHAPTFAAAWRELRDLGCDEVNWNLGCPYPMVAGRGRGAGLLPHPDRIAAILEHVLATGPARLSVKLRLGYRDPDEFTAVLDVLNRYPLAEVILHARTAAQMYGGSADIDRAARALVLSRHPFVYNGDITSPAVFCKLGNRLPGTAAWMIGRGALACPFLPARLHGRPWPPDDVRRRSLREFHDQLLEGYRHGLSGPGHLSAKLAEQWAYLARAFADPHAVLGRVRRGWDTRAYAAAVDWAFDQPLAPLPPEPQAPLPA